MRTRQEVSAEKLRGGFYTPPPLVDFCIGRARACLGAARDLRVLEPSAGDGAFIRGLTRGDPALAAQVAFVRPIEIVDTEAAKVQLSLSGAGVAGDILTTSCIEWAASTDELFDLVLGNPPFVRYQFVSSRDRAAIERLGIRLGIAFGGVSNLWIPVLLGAVSRLREGGVLSMVIPTECFTGCSAAAARAYLAHEIADLRFDIFPPGSFPGVLQEVTVVSGRRHGTGSPASRAITVVDHAAAHGAHVWTRVPGPDDLNWTNLLLEPQHVEALAAARSLPCVRPLSEVAKLEVSIVTGANRFFCVDDGTAKRYELEPWCRPLLSRGRLAPGLVLAPRDLERAREAGAPVWLLDFSSETPDPMMFPRAAEYLALGRRDALHERYKCRIRSPWYRVPGIKRGALLLSKRSHLFPRLTLNRAAAFTTDTIYRGEVLRPGSTSEADLVAGFHSSLTLLTAELEGRSFGGGVLELVPGEVARLSVMSGTGLARHLAALDARARSGDPEELVAATDALLVAESMMPADLVGVLADARQALVARRLDRNRRRSDRSVAVGTLAA